MRFHRDEVPLTSRRSSFREPTLSQLSFAGMEAELRRMMDEDKDHTRGAELVAQMEEALNLVFDEISFEMGFNGEKHELILTPEGDKIKLFELVYFQKHAPGEVLEHWNILVGPSALSEHRPAHRGRLGHLRGGCADLAGGGPRRRGRPGDPHPHRRFQPALYCCPGGGQGAVHPDMQEKWDIPVEEYDAGGGKGRRRAGVRGGRYAGPLSAWPTVLSPAARPTRKTTICGRMRSKQAREHRAHLLVAVLGTDADPNDPRDFLASLASYVLENDVELRDGETIGFTADDKHAITRSPGVGLPEEQMTLKISWRSGGDGPDEGGDDPDDGEDDVVEMDDGAFHLETIQEKSLPVDEITPTTTWPSTCAGAWSMSTCARRSGATSSILPPVTAKAPTMRAGLPSGWKARKCCGAT